MRNETLFLPRAAYPDGFPIATDDAEIAICGSINEVGKNRDVRKVRYENLTDCFPHFANFTSKFVGAICTTEAVETAYVPPDDPYVWTEQLGTGWAVHKIEAFVVLTAPDIQSRNTFVAQPLFPFLFTQINTASNSPCKILSSKPIYLLCMAPDGVEVPSSVKRDFNFVSAAGVVVLSPLRQDTIIEPRALTIEEMSIEQSKLGMFSLDSESKVFSVAEAGLQGLTDDTGKIKGSNEKFGMLSLITSALVAKRSGYQIDYQFFARWMETIRSDRSRTKTQNLEHVLQFLSKIAD